ncbi:HmuY family protein [uncultured Imperialibacter sp.]|uniref:HmuY family protein n=1 Tax=uncultured Imperialibacter sp. TaxID=1672639 RepID=UPI0030D806C0|tara:strand:- start:15844 stop:17262 length:1419 start_codon:yes stop_codon:yes gene_type:complete
MKQTITHWIKAKYFILSICSAAILTACGDDEPALPDNLVNFPSAQQSITEDESELEVVLSFSRALDVATANITVELSGENIAHGTKFTTTPAASNDAITLTVAEGSEQASFTVSKVDGALFDGDEVITFTLSTSTDGLLPGTTATMTLSFAEILAAQGQIDIEGGGATYPNKVFIDLSANRQTAVNRDSWDLGFYSGADFKVILNSSVTMFAQALEKTDLAEVTATDTVGFAAAMSINAFSTDAFGWIDDPSGDLDKTAIAEISASADENVVYIINRGEAPAATAGAPGEARGWKKIKISQTADGYLLQYADISATTFEEIEIDKVETQQFVYAHFEDGIVDVEPAKDKWDIAWTGFMNSTNFGGGAIPYYFQDIVLQNTAGVETAMVVTETKSYESFSSSDIASLEFSESQTAIGSTWRVTGGPGGSQPGVYEDRFYVIKDTSGNYYKLKFTALMQGGERGKPQIAYELLD